MHSADAFGQFDWNPTEHFNVIAGLRFDYFSESNVRHFSPHLGLMYKIGNCSLRALMRRVPFAHLERDAHELLYGKHHDDLW